LKSEQQVKTKFDVPKGVNCICKDKKSDVSLFAITN